MPNKKFSTSINFVYTGPMKLAHFAGAPEQNIDAFVTSKSFSEFGFKSSYIFNLNKINTDFELFGGIKNIFDAYQSDFDTGKNKDSNYIYGPATPRTIFIGLKMSSF